MSTARCFSTFEIPSGDLMRDTSFNSIIGSKFNLVVNFFLAGGSIGHPVSTSFMKFC
jgi:hypothetical protein